LQTQRRAPVETENGCRHVTVEMGSVWRGEQVRERAASEVTKTPEPRLA